MVIPVTLVSLEAKGMVLKHNLLEIIWGWGCVWYLKKNSVQNTHQEEDYCDQVAVHLHLPEYILFHCKLSRLLEDTIFSNGLSCVLIVQ